MSNTAIEVITSVQRRRRWSAAEKERLVAGALEPGASVSAVARAPVRIPRPEWWIDQGALARWPGHVFVRQAAGARPLCVAIDRSSRRCGPNGDDHVGRSWDICWKGSIGG